MFKKNTKFVSILICFLFVITGCNFVFEDNKKSSSNTYYGTDVGVVKGDLHKGESFTLPINNIEKNKIYSFSCKIIGDFGGLTLGHGKTKYSSGYLTLTKKNIIVNTYLSECVSTTFEHNILISDYLKIVVELDNEGMAKATLYSNDDVYDMPKTFFIANSQTNDFIECNGGDLVNCVFSVSCKDLNKDLFVFGDSYVGINSKERWAYYLHSNNYDNMLLNGCPGEGSADAIVSLKNVLLYSTPKTILWCLGMNDGGDSKTPSKNWINTIVSLQEICNNLNIELILSTIPTVPNINHERKNEYVRNSGYRYIDFAAGVGANGDGNWFLGMLSDDNVHPTSLGAQSLFNQAIIDCPELSY